MRYEEAKLVTFLLLVMKGKRRRRLKQTEVARETGMSQQSVSRLLRTLEDRGLIARIVKGRGEYVEVTSEGLRKAEELAGLASSLVEEDQNVIVLEGVVVSGLGEGRYYISMDYYSSMINKLLGFKPYPGTLNIRLVGESIWKRRQLNAYRSLHIPGFKDEKRVYGGAWVFKAKVNGYGPAGVVIPERTSHGSEILEIVAPDYLRSVLGLKDGDRVVVEVSIPNDTSPGAASEEGAGTGESSGGEDA